MVFYKGTFIAILAAFLLQLQGTATAQVNYQKKRQWLLLRTEENSFINQSYTFQVLYTKVINVGRDTFGNLIFQKGLQN